jgi:methionyl-tRNA formyltransferase
VTSEHRLKIIFAGTPEFAAVALQKLLTSSHEIIAVYTQPDRPAGRGRKLTASVVKELALTNNIPVYQPVSLRDAAEQKKLSDLQADVMVVAAYGLLLPTEVLTAPRFGCVNIHPSLLPRWRGAAPIQHSILAGDAITGVSIMQMEEGLDSGPVLYQQEYQLSGQDTSATLHDTLAQLGATALLTTLADIASHHLKPQLQNPALVTYARKFSKTDGCIDWNASAAAINARIRAFNPWPVAYTTVGALTLRIWTAQVMPALTTNAAPGTIIKTSTSGVDVATGGGEVLRLIEMQLPGGRALPAAALLNANQNDLEVGTILGSS